MFEKLLWESIRALLWSTRERKQTTVHSPNLRLPAASAQLHSLLWDPPASQSSEKGGRKKNKSGVERWSEEVRRWGWGPSLPENGDLTLKRHRPPWSIFHRCLSAVGLSPHSPLLLLCLILLLDSIAPWHYRPGEMPAILNHSDAVFTDLPAISLSAALYNSIATDISPLLQQSQENHKSKHWAACIQYTAFCMYIYLYILNTYGTV